MLPYKFHVTLQIDGVAMSQKSKKRFQKFGSPGEILNGELYVPNPLPTHKTFSSKFKKISR